MSIAEGRPQTSSPFAPLNPFAATVADDPVSRGLHESARKMIGIALFSGVINLLMLSGSLYMLQVYDRVIPSRNLATLAGLSLIVLFAYLMQGYFDALRSHFDVPQLVEMTHIIALENLRARFNLALGIGSAGFSEGMVCALPD